MFLYDLPHWLLGIVIVAMVVIPTYAGYFLFHRYFASACTEENKGVAMAVLAVVATVNSLLLAFSAVSVWESFSNAEEAVVMEANSLASLARDLAVYDTTESRHVRTMLRKYADMVIALEWPDMREGRANMETWNYFDSIVLATGTIRADTPTKEALLREIWNKMNQLVNDRRTRVYTSQAHVPNTLWAVVVIGTILAVMTTFVLPKTGFNLLMIGVLSISIGLVFFFIVAMDRPFVGAESMSPWPLESSIQNIDRWDKVIQPR